MAINSLRAFFFIAGGAVVVGGAAYVTGALDGFFPEKPTAIASLPSSQSAPSAAPSVEEPVASAAEPAAEAQEVAREVVVPAFDLVRVGPDGSLVIAGSAAPFAGIEIVTGASAIGTGATNEAGDFAIVLDDPLKPGDYTIVLRSTTREGVVATSTETAVVSVPDHPSGQVLALVEQPGAPSRLITVPEAAAPKGDRPATAEPQQTAAEEVEQPETTTEQAIAPAQPAGEEKPAEIAAAPEPEQQPAERAATAETAEPAVEEEQEVAVAPAPAEVAPQAEEAREEQQMAAVAEPQPAQEQAPALTEKPRVAVEAVEIDGSRVFVAGRAEAGSRVRVYANEILLGDARTSEGGRFLVEAERDLPVGDYIVRADLLGPAAEVLARAAVPFEREPGEAIAAVAAPEPEPAPAKPEPVAQAAEEPAVSAQAEPAQPEPAKPVETAEAAVPAPQGDEKPAEQQVASAPAAAEPVIVEAAEPTAEAAADEPEITAPRLQSVSGSVIIRRGDTLWHISKRVYGHGVRYTTIYLANQDQIRNPDLIWPGQVFSVPGRTEAGEDADLSAIADRMAPAEDAETR